MRPVSFLLEVMRKGSKHTKKSIKKMTKIQSHRSGKWRKRIAAKMKLRRHSPATKFKMSESHKGINTWSKGKKKSIKTRKKMSLSRMNQKNPAWKGGISSKHDRLRSSAKLDLWRKRVFARDNYICGKCSKQGYRLNAHHIFNFTEYPNLRCDINNGITFCEKCHKKFHILYGIKFNNVIQLLEYIGDINANLPTS